MTFKIDAFKSMMNKNKENLRDCYVRDIKDEE